MKIEMLDKFQIAGFLISSIISIALVAAGQDTISPQGSLQEGRARLYGSVLCSRLEYWAEPLPLLEFLAMKGGDAQ